MKIKITQIYDVEIKKISSNTTQYKVHNYIYHLIELISKGKKVFEVYNATNIQHKGFYKRQSQAIKMIDKLFINDLKKGV